MSAPRTLDVSELPTWALGIREPIWWGVAFMMAIEGTMLLLLVTTYLYLRGNFEAWPPTGPSRGAFYASLVGMIALLVSLAPMAVCSRAARAGDMRRARGWLVVVLALGAVFLASRWIELDRIAFRWDLHAYGSVFWTTLGFHTIHGLSSMVENLMFLALLFSGRVEEKHRADLQSNALYWYFVVLIWLPTWALLYLDGLR